MSRWRRQRPPAEVLSQLHLAPGERPLAWAVDRDGDWLIGTDRSLHLACTAGHRRLGWEQIERADWQQESSRLSVVESADWGQVERREEISIDDPGQLLELLRERVTKSVITTAYARLRPRTGISVVARRSPVGDGPVLWSYVLAEGLDPQDPEVLEVTQRLQQQAAAELAGL